MLKTLSREFKLMFGSWMMITVLVIIPILVNILLGFEFCYNQIQHIPMAIIDQDNSSTSRMIVQQFCENEIFNVKYYPNDSSEMKKLMDDSKIRVGMIIPKNFNNDVLTLQSPTILMLYDGSHMSVASTAKTKASEILLTLKTGVLIKLIEGNLSLPAETAEKMALAINFSNRTLYNPAKSFKNFLTPGFGAAIVQSAVVLMAAAAIKAEELETKKSKRAGYLLGKIIFYTGWGTFSLIASILIQSKWFGVPFRGNFMEAILFSIALSASIASFALMISSWIRDTSFALLVNAVIFVPNSVMVGYTWPVLSMPKPYQIAATFFPFYHYADPLRDMYLKGVPGVDVLHEMLWFAAFTLITFVIGWAGVLHLKPTVSIDANGNIAPDTNDTTFIFAEEGDADVSQPLTPQ